MIHKLLKHIDHQINHDFKVSKYIWCY